MDVIVAHQCGFKNAIGTMGTALTSTHAKKIKRFTSKVYLAMDSDEAGQQAIDRCDEVLKKENITTYVIKMEIISYVIVIVVKVKFKKIIMILMKKKIIFLILRI